MISKSSIHLILFNVVIISSFIFIECKESNHFKDSSSSNSKQNEKIRICIVENIAGSSFRRTEQYCPIIEKKSNIECVIGTDRLDCARRISKGQAHFGVFSSEDLVGSRWASLEILVTNEIRFNDHEFEYDLVMIVDNEANIHSAVDLKGSRFCHPGKGLDTSWNDILSDYPEKVMIPRGCETDLSLTESRIKATSNYFGESCKAGPWVNDPNQDQILKSKYPSLCSLCYEPSKCAKGDKHWGRRGPLYCLTSGTGEVAYVRLDDVRSFFGFTGLTPEADPNNYSYLCPDSHLQPLNVENPCTWIAKPWPVLAAKRSHAEKVQELFRGIDITSEWQQALLQLLESYHVNISSLDFPMTIDDYLDKSSGYQSAHSFTACYPPRQIVYCTSTLIEFAKCSWLQEVSNVYGIEPNVQCIRGENLFRCLDDVAKDVADIVIINQDERLRSESNFNLTSILYEYSKDFEENYVTIAVVKADSNIRNFEDLRGKKACFPAQEGAAYLSVSQTLNELQLSTSNCSNSVEKYFSPNSCFGRVNDCDGKFNGDEGAFHCLQQQGDVAFLDMLTFKNLTAEHSQNYRVICPFENQNNNFHYNYDELCYLSYTSRGVFLTSKTKTSTRIDEIINTFKSMDSHFGKQKFRSGNIPFTIFGKYDKKSDVLFRDSTDGFKTKVEFANYKRFLRNSEEHFNVIIDNYNHPNCKSLGEKLNWSFMLILVTIVLIKIR